MRARSWFRVHSWVGVVTGLLLFVLCWSGTVATVAHELDWLLTPRVRAMPSSAAALPLEVLYRRAQQAYPQASVARVQAAVGPGFAAQAVMEFPDQKSVRIHLDPATGAILGRSSYFSVQRFFRSFHIALFNGQWGLYVVWLMAIPLTLSFVAPLVFYKRWWCRFLDLKTGKGWRVFWSDAHKLAGVWSLWFVAVIAVTALWFLFEALRGDLGDGKNAWVGEGRTAVVRLPVLPPGPPAPLEQLMERVRQERPDLDVKTISLQRSGYFYVDGQSHHWLLRDRANKLYLNARDGSVAYNQDASHLSAYWRWSDTADPLHFGDFAGLASKLVWFAFGLLLTGMSLSGAWLHAQRLYKNPKGQRRARWPGAGPAIAVSCLILAASVAGGWEEIRDYGPLIDGARDWPQVPWEITSFITGWVLLTIGILAWWSGLLARAGRSISSASPGVSARKTFS